MPLHAELLERPQVGSVGEDVWRKLMFHTVARDERHSPVADRSDHDRSGGLAVRGIDPNLGDVLEERVETRAAEHTDANRVAAVARAQADLSFVPDDDDPAFSPEVGSVEPVEPV